MFQLHEIGRAGRGLLQLLCFLSALALALCVICHSPAAQSRPRRAARAALARVERLIAQENYPAALERLEQLARGKPLPSRGRFLQAYALFKLARLEEARQTLAPVLEDQFTAEAGLLSGMVALEQERYQEAEVVLRRVVALAEDPWLASAGSLLERAEAALAAHEQRFQQTIARAKQLLEQKQLAGAGQALDQAEALAPGRLLVRYYRGFLAYQQRDYPAAQRHLRAALALAPRDEWTRYMLALALRDSGRAVAARPLLRELVASAADGQVRREAQEALSLLSQPAVPPPAASKNELALELTAGLGLDTNPNFIEESPAELEEAGLALQLRGQLGYQRTLVDQLKVGLGVTANERAYAVGGEDAEHTAIGGWARILWRPGRLALAFSYAYSLLLFGHQPLLSQHAGELEAKIALSKQLSLFTNGLLSYRDVHESRYAYLQALQAGGAAGAELLAGPLTLGLSYLLLKDWAGSVTVPLTLYGAAGRGSHGPGTAVDYELRADYSMIGHGPSLQLQLRLPWKLLLVGAVGLQRRSYQGPDLLVNKENAAVTQLSIREDWYFSAEAELARPLGKGINLILRYESLDNFSTQNDAELGLDRSYSQRLAAVLVRWSWPGL